MRPADAWWVEAAEEGLEAMIEIAPRGAAFTAGMTGVMIRADADHSVASGSFNEAAGSQLQLDRNTTPVVLWPNGPGSSSQWTPAGCTQTWQCVSESTSAGDTTRAETPIPRSVDAYALQDLTQTSGTVLSVTVTAVAKDYARGCNKDLSSCGRDIALQVNGYTGSTQGLGNGYLSKSQPWTTNPATGQPWTIGQVNARQAGVKLLDTVAVNRVTQVSVSVVLVDRTAYVNSDGPTGMDQLTSMTDNGSTTTTFGYDANGNLISKFGATKTCYAWNPENLLTQAKAVSSACTETGTLTRKRTSTTASGGD